MTTESPAGFQVGLQGPERPHVIHSCTYNLPSHTEQELSDSEMRLFLQELVQQSDTGIAEFMKCWQ